VSNKLLIGFIVTISTLVTSVVLAGFFAYQYGYNIGYDAKQDFIVEEHPKFKKMKECVTVYSNKSNWSGLFSKIWVGGGYGYSNAQAVLGIEDEDPSWWSHHCEECPICSAGKNVCEEAFIKMQDSEMRKYYNGEGF